MTSTPVREASPALTGMTAARGKSTADMGVFQKVWSSQMSMGAQGGFTQKNAADTIRQDMTLRQGGGAKLADSRTASDKASGKVPDKTSGMRSADGGEGAENVRQDADPGAENVREDLRQTQDLQDGQNAGQESQTAGDAQDAAGAADAVQPGVTGGLQAGEPGPEELAQAMEVLGTAAFGLIWQIADTFGVSVEEVQAAMDELGMEPVDVLDAPDLGSLALKLGGAEDSCALVTDEALYEKYRVLTGELENVLQESAEALEVNPEEIAGLAEKLPKAELSEGKIVFAETARAAAQEIIPERERAEEPYGAEPRTENLGTVEAVQGSQNPQDAQEQAQEGGTEEGRSGQRRAAAGGNADKADKVSQVNPFAQEFRAGFQPETQQTEAVPQGSTWSADTRSIMNQIMDFMKLQLNADTTNLEMQLHPANLGTVQVQIASKGGMVTAHFITQNEAVKAALEGQMAQLRENFEEQGVKVEAIEVTVQTHQFEQNLEQGRERGQQEPGKKNRTRRINLNEISAEDMDEEETLAADMMAASGSTVDYTA